MAGRHSAVNPTTNDDSTAKTNMLDMWKDSIQRTQKERTAAVQTAKNENESRADLEQRVRNGQAQCQTCAQRAYQDQSNDGGVSFQAARHISASTAGIAVTSHEHEHVAAGDAESNAEEGGVVKSSTVGLEYGKCPECGRTYVKGGVTRTTSRPASYRKRNGGLDVNV